MVRVGTCLARATAFFVAALISTKVYLYFTFFLVHRLRPRYPSLTPFSQETKLHPTDNAHDGLLWFVHITDIHISKFYDPRRTEDFRSFCGYLARHVKPSAVVVSGDITDAKDRNLYGSAQLAEEWRSYSQIVRESGVLSTAKWMDVRGNHDTFDVVSDYGGRNLFAEYSMQGGAHQRSYAETVAQNNVSVNFVAVDFSPMPGMKRPFNFFGTLTPNEIKEVEAMMETEASETVLFGHYPTSTVVGNVPSIRNILSNRLYLCGHFHTLHLYTRHQTGLLELELSDWKDKRIFRIGVFDRGLFSFTDLAYHHLRPSVAVVVTNPKDPTFHRENEPRPSSTVRTMVFSTIPIRNVSLMLPGGNATAMSPSVVPGMEQSPLYLAEWNPALYEQGLHTIRIVVTLDDGSVHEHKSTFSLDGSQVPFDLRSRVLLMMDWKSFSEYVYALLASAILLSLTTLRLQNGKLLGLKGRVRGEPYPMRIPKFRILASLNQLYAPLIAYVLYICFMPWAFGYVFNDRIGLIFVWGIIMIDDLAVFSSDMAHIYGVGALVLKVIFVIILANAVERRYEKICLVQDKAKEDYHTLKERDLVEFALFVLREHFALTVLVIVQAHNTWALYGSYGLIAILSPIGIGRIAFTIYVYTRAMRLKKSDFLLITRNWE